jgi:ankyrin repeat protein
MASDYTLAVASRWAQILEMDGFLMNGASTEVRDHRGQTPLYEAAYAGRVGVLEKLLEYSADPHTRNDKGETALNAAAEKGHVRVVQILYDHGADLDLADMVFSTTPLHGAVVNAHVEMVRLLIELGADQSRRDDHGFTALDYAIESVRFHDEHIPRKHTNKYALCMHQMHSGTATDRRQIVEMLEVEETRKGKCLAFAMGQHARLGEGSLVDGLDPNVVEMILHMV